MNYKGEYIEFYNCFFAGITYSIKSSGLSRVKLSDRIELNNLSEGEIDVWVNEEKYANDYKRGKVLSSMPIGSGHDCFMKGIVVWAHLRTTQRTWRQIQRYHFFDIITEQSKMYNLHTAQWPDDFVSTTPYESYIAFDNCRRLYLETQNVEGITDEEKSKAFETMQDACPCGLLTTAAVVTNYLQLKTMYHQRKKHKTKAWREICQWIEKLPMSNLITTLRRKDNDN